jgi:hypothetical protein
MEKETLHFGAKGWKGNTPAAIKIIYRVLIAAVFIWQLVDMNFPEIPDAAASLISRALNIGTPILYAIGNAFGYTKE